MASFIGMKQLLAILMIVFALPCFSQKKYEIYYQSETDENIQLTVIVYDVKEKQADSYASLYAIQSLIFDGIKGSKRRYLPYVQDEKQSFEEHSAYYHNLFDNGGFWSFIIASAIVEKGKKEKKEKYYVVNLNVNHKALKDSLSNHNVIRRFGV